MPHKPCTGLESGGGDGLTISNAGARKATAWKRRTATQPNDLSPERLAEPVRPLHVAAAIVPIERLLLIG